MNCFTVDLEEWFNLDFGGFTPNPSEWDGLESRVEQGMDKLLRLGDETGTTMTIFTLGWIARRHPTVVRRAHAAGHEIGCHTMWHRPINEMNAEELRDDLHEAKAAIEDACSAEVVSFRAPYFSVSRQDTWFFQTLAEEGFKYDSSIFPGRRAKTGDVNAPSQPYMIETSAGPIYEFPVSVVGLLGQRFTIFGGGYFRLTPVRIVMSATARMNRRNEPVMFYIHPHDLDPGQPRPVKGLLSRFRRYHGLGSTEQKLSKLLRHHQFFPLREAAPHHLETRT